ncbi:stage III sporulation protein AG [Aneurinibacillus tyrosinisolvens]|uniref:stage III sporulation protein AG n=1 Tax=Aneurinibacillus tyrosinisolvens TaxID=1443435 RepID=UPI00063F29DD|nr:stage III sporulation protein AG [Aneurinibacillus tyrosinisolvens]
MAGEKWSEKWKRIKGDEDGTRKRPAGIQTLLIIGALGIAVMILSSFFNGLQNTPKKPPEPAESTAVLAQKNHESYTMEEYEAMYEKQLKDVLQSIDGVGQVSVMVNIDSTEEIVVEKNRNKHSQVTKEADKGATREINDESSQEQVVITRKDKDEQPVVLKTVKPRVRGVVVVASGAQNLQVKAWILEAVQKVLAVPSYKISILPKKP